MEGREGEGREGRSEREDGGWVRREDGEGGQVREGGG